jgi:hypothetical protein
MPHEQPSNSKHPPAQIRQRREVYLDCVLGLRACAATVCTVRVARELDRLSSRQLQDFLELLANVHQDLLALLRRAPFATRNITVSSTRDALADRAGPDANTVEALADVDNDAHELSVVLVLERLADRREHDVQPELVDRDAALVFKLVGPFATMLVLDVFPFWSDAFLEEVVVGFEGELGDGSDVVL